MVHAECSKALRMSTRLIDDGRKVPLVVETYWLKCESHQIISATFYASDMEEALGLTEDE